MVSVIYVDADSRSHLLPHDDFVMNSGGVGQKSQTRTFTRPAGAEGIYRTAGESTGMIITICPAENKVH